MFRISFGVVIRICVSLGIIFVLLRQIDLVATAQIMLDADVRFMLLAIVLMSVSRLLMGLKWGILLKARGVRQPWWHLTKVYYLASFLGQVLPATVGADALRLFFLTRNSDRTDAILSTIIIERLIGLIVLTTFACVGVTLAAEFDDSSIVPAFIFYGCWILLGAELAVFGIVLSKWGSGLGRWQLGSRADSRLSNFLRLVCVALLSFRYELSALLRFSLLTICEALLCFCGAVAVMYSLNLQIPLSLVAALLPLQFLLIRLPISLAGWGLHEAGFVWFLVAAGAPEAAGLGVGVVHHVLQLAALTPALYILAADTGILKLVKPKLGRTSNLTDSIGEA